MAEKIIDSFCILPLKDPLKDLATIPLIQKGYIDLFGIKIASMLGIEDQFLEMKENATFEQLNSWMINKITALSMEITDFLSLLDDWLVESIIYHNQHSEIYSKKPNLSNVKLHELISNHSDRIYLLAGADPREGKKALDHLSYCITELNFIGFSTIPFMNGLYADDEKYMPFYKLCESLDVPVWIHTSMNFSRGLSNDFGHPKHLEKIMINYPDLKVIAGHGGWPWIIELIALARKYPNLYIDTSTHRPSHFSRPGTRCDPLISYVNNLVLNLILFGSSWVMTGQTIDNLVKEVQELPLKLSVKRKWLYENAKELFNI